MSMQRTCYRIIVILLASLIINQGCNREWEKHYNTVDALTLKEKILAEMEGIPDISSFTEAVKQVEELEDLLSQSRLYTVFAPNNEAFDRIDPAVLADEVLFRRLIKYHFINGKYNLKDFIAADITTFNEKYLNFSFEENTKDLLIDNKAKIVDPDYLSQNGIIQVIDNPLVPKNNVYESLIYSDYSKRIGESIPSYTEKTFNKEASTAIGTTPEGRTIYDSVFLYSNPFLYQGFENITTSFYEKDFRFLNIEDEKALFTVIIPENFAQAADLANQQPYLNNHIEDKDLAGPILANLIYKGGLTKEEVIEDINTRYASSLTDTTDLEYYFMDLLVNQYDEEIKLSNGAIYKVKDFVYDLGWLIKTRGGIPVNLSETAYQNELISSALFSEEINNIDINLRNIRTTFFRAKPYIAPGESLKINFQPEGSSVPDGYLPDYGYAFGERESGFVYGWVEGNVFDTRNRGGSDPVLTTLNHMIEDGVNSHSWEIEVPNGDYIISIIAGDESNTDQVNNLMVEDQYVKDTEVGNNFDWFDDIPVTVSDGRLTISPHQDGKNQKLIAIEIIFPDIGQNDRDSLAYENSYGEWVEFNLQGPFYPLDYRLMVRGKNKESGTYKIEMEGQEIAEYDFSTSPSGDLDSEFDEIGTVRFLEKKSSANIKFTFLETHPGENKDEQYLWIREIKLVPVME
jgi:uncharacterized surface protein with fasciclin (FAS1) repeats